MDAFMSFETAVELQIKAAEKNSRTDQLPLDQNLLETVLGWTFFSELTTQFSMIPTLIIFSISNISLPWVKLVFVAA